MTLAEYLFAAPVIAVLVYIACHVADINNRGKQIKQIATAAEHKEGASDGSSQT